MSAPAAPAAAATAAATAAEEQNGLEAPYIMASYARACSWTAALEEGLKEFRDASGSARQIAEMRRSLRETGIADEDRLPDGIRREKMYEAIRAAHRWAERVREAGDSVYRIVNGERDVGGCRWAAYRADSSRGERPESDRRRAAGKSDDSKGAGSGPCFGR